MSEGEKPEQYPITGPKQQKGPAAEDPGISATQEAGPPLEPEISEPDVAGLWGDDLIVALTEERGGSRALGRHLLSFVLRETRKKDREIDTLRGELKEVSRTLTNEQIAHGYTQARLITANITPALSFGPIVAALGIAVHQGGLRVYGASLVGIGLLWMAFGVWTWLSGR
jgi:hypothetical protein